MLTLHEVATLTAKGQITLPKPIRQALGVDYGSTRLLLICATHRW